MQTQYYFHLETEIDKTFEYSMITKKEILNTTKLFFGEILQKPPIFSAIKVNGERLYKKARKKFQIMFLFSLIPFFIVNGFLTGSFTENAVVLYDDQQNLGIRILNIPMEDIFYCFNILVLVVVVYEYRLSKILSVK